MTRKLSRNYSLSVVAASVAILALLIAAAVLAQTSGAGQTSGKANAVLAQAGTTASAQAQRPLTPWIDGAERFSVTRSQTKRHSARPMDSPPLFLPAVNYSSGGDTPTSAVVADLNGDGKPDIVVVNNQSSTIGVLLGNGDGTFQPVVTYDSGGQLPNYIAIADVNGDGKPDIVVASLWTDVCVLLGNGDGTFQPAVIYDSGGVEPVGVAVADVNRDGKPDLIVANFGSNTVGVLLGNGDGTFQPAVTYDAGGDPWYVAVADVNGDGNPDLVIANIYSPSSSNLAVLLGNGDGTFQAPVTYGSGAWDPMSIAVADVNGDKKLDLVVANCESSSGLSCGQPSEGLVGVLLGNGDGTFQPAVPYDSGGGLLQSATIADVNGDGKLDLLTANFENNVGVLLGNGDGTFQPPLTFTACMYPIWIIGADVNGDGLLDLVVACHSGSVGVLLNNSGPHSPTTTALVSSLNPSRIKQSVTYTATVTNQNGGKVTGSITFQDGGSTVATVQLVNNQAAYSTTYTKGGSHAITATYSGDVSNLGSTSATLVEYIESVVTKTVVTTSGSPSFVGQPVTFTATVTSTYGAIPDGELVTFYDGKPAIGTGATASGVATFVTSSLKAETHTIKATYPGDATFEPSTGSVKQVVDKYPTTTALSSSLNPSNYGQAVTFTATVTSAGPTPTGKVRLKDGTKAIGTVTLSGGVATLTTSKLAVGTHAITAEYLGDANNDGSTSPVLNQVVQ
jgi:hypothetical protein